VSGGQWKTGLPHGGNSEEENLPHAVNQLDGIPRYLDDLRNEILSEGKERIRIPGVVFVTDIVGYFYPYQGEINDYQRIKGALYHYAIQSALRIVCTPEVTIEKQFEGVTIRGRVDLVCGDWLGEIKGSRYSRNQGILQLQLYDWILGGGKKLLLIYSDLTYEVVPPNPKVEEMVRKYLKAKLF